MEISFDKIANALYICFSHNDIKISEEIIEGIIIDYDKNKTIIGIEILNFLDKNIDLNEIIKLGPEEIIPKVVQWQKN
ncbi:MAG: DUF2283 domain-containing protein [Promethearchaeota archaeon]